MTLPVHSEAGKAGLPAGAFISPTCNDVVEDHVAKSLVLTSEQPEEQRQQLHRLDLHEHNIVRSWWQQSIPQS